jgi:YegS/Rv2252/BmrU family lipid kinase
MTTVTMKQDSGANVAGAGRCLILANPKAGGLWKHEMFAALRAPEGRFWRRRKPQAAEPHLPAALPLLAQLAADAGLEANVEAVPSPTALPSLLRTAQDEGFDTIVAVGGDGTIRTIAQALVHSPLRLGILPMGTANNMAHTLGIPFGLEEALRVLATGVERSIDVGRIGNEYFLEGAGVGLFADAIQGFGAEEPRGYQITRLLRVMWPLFWYLRKQTLALTLDGVEQREEAVMVTVANGAYLGDGMLVAPHAALTDGRFDVLIVGALTRLEMCRFASAVHRGQHLSLPKVRLTQARSVEIRRIHGGHRPLPIHADDHIVGSTPARMESVPGALRVILPR